MNAEIRAKKSEHQRTVDRRDLWRFISFYFLSRLSNTSLCRPGKLICCLVLFIYIVIGFDPFDSKYIPQAMMAQSSWPLYKNWLHHILYHIYHCIRKRVFWLDDNVNDESKIFIYSFDDYVLFVPPLIFWFWFRTQFSRSSYPSEKSREYKSSSLNRGHMAKYPDDH